MQKSDFLNETCPLELNGYDVLAILYKLRLVPISYKVFYFHSNIFEVCKNLKDFIQACFKIYKKYTLL